MRQTEQPLTRTLRDFINASRRAVSITDFTARADLMRKVGGPTPTAVRNALETLWRRGSCVRMPKTHPAKFAKSGTAGGLTVDEWREHTRAVVRKRKFKDSVISDVVLPPPDYKYNDEYDGHSSSDDKGVSIEHGPFKVSIEGPPYRIIIEGR